ncbi:hypothetical protein BT96DRAFT_1007629 [Gymnopus androsaceus JB14]|uniref:Uncharacterized protein n=1 Tax=Gymnopus androsaceus JB14 TaxID=1447944 RepID=A0A6A4GHD3_9AGAR|nr:hypothetical protein BT96DRAFT_1007629 [Gymnopus androsaceus JB14]
MIITLPTPLTPESAIVPLPPLPTPSSHSDSSGDMSSNLSGTGFVNMGSTKTGCQLLVAHPTLEALKEYFDYSTINHDECSITDDTVKKKDFIRDKPWIEKHPDQPKSSKDYICCPFFDKICNHVLGSDWAHLHDLKRDGYVMRHEPRGFLKLCTLMESHNRSLRGTQFHKPDEVLQVLIIQKLPEKSRADLVDCKVSEQLPYAEWKKECQGVERHCPPGGPSYATEQKKVQKKFDGHGATCNNQYLPHTNSFQSIPDLHKFPKLSLLQCSLLMSIEGCFQCYTLYAGHIGGQCPTKKPPVLSVPYRPLMDADISFAKKCHDHSPNNSIPYELVLKQNPIAQTSLHPVATVQSRLPLTNVPDFGQPASAPGLFNIQPHGIHAIYSSRPIIHATSGSGIYGGALDHGFNYNSVSRPVRRPVAAMVPSRHPEYVTLVDVIAPLRDLLDVSLSLVCTIALILALVHVVVLWKENTSSREADLHKQLRDHKDDPAARSPKPARKHVCARSAPSVSADSMPLVLPHLEWQAKINGPVGFTLENLLLDSACPFVLIHANLVASLGLKRYRLHHPQEMTLAMSSGSNETSASHEFCKVQINDPSLSWYSRTVCALIVPSLCAPMILSLPFLTHNNLVIDYSSRTVIDKISGFDLLHPITCIPAPLPMSPKERRRRLFLDQQDLLDVVVAVHARIKDLENHERLDKLSDKFKTDYADVFTPIAHTLSLPEDITCKITLKDANQIIQT